MKSTSREHRLRTNHVANDTDQLTRLLPLKNDPTAPFDTLNVRNPVVLDKNNVVIGIHSHEEGIVYGQDVKQPHEENPADRQGRTPYGRGIL